MKTQITLDDPDDVRYIGKNRKALVRRRGSFISLSEMERRNKQRMTSKASYNPVTFNAIPECLVQLHSFMKLVIIGDK